MQDEKKYFQVIQSAKYQWSVIEKTQIQQKSDQLNKHFSKIYTQTAKKFTKYAHHH